MISFRGNFFDDLYVMNTDSSGQVNLTDTPSQKTFEGDPSWLLLPGPSVPKSKAECKKNGILGR
jgi:hypothetical protein